MRKQLQLVLIAIILLPASTGVLLASDTPCRIWVAQIVTNVEQSVVRKRHHYSKKVLAAWAVWRAKHPHAKLAPKKPLRPGRAHTQQDIAEVLGYDCTHFPTVDEAVALALPEDPQAMSTVSQPDLFSDMQMLPTVVANSGSLPPGGTPTNGSAPGSAPRGIGGFDSPGFPGGGGGAPIFGGGPPSGNPPTTGSSAPPPVTPPIAVAPEPSSLVLFATGLAALAVIAKKRPRPVPVKSSRA